MNGINFDAVASTTYEFTKQGQTYLLSDAIPTEVMVEAMLVQALPEELKTLTDTAQIVQTFEEIKQKSLEVVKKFVKVSYSNKTDQEIAEIAETFDLDERMQLIAFFSSRVGKRYEARLSVLQTSGPKQRTNRPSLTNQQMQNRNRYPTRQH